jgi:hypothetical protein
MATATIRPDGTIYGGGTLTGGAGSTHATLSDNSDGTYASKAAGSPPDHVRFGTSSKPAGAILSTIRPWMKLQSSSGTTKADFWASFGLGAVYGLSVNNTPTIYYGPTIIVGDQSQAWIDGLEMLYRTPSGSTTRFLEAGIDLVFPEPPTCAITAPTGTVLTSDFTISWTHTPGTDGAGQSAFQLKTFTAAQFGGFGFDEDTSSAYYDSGTVSSGAGTFPGVGFGAGVWRIYVRTAQAVGGTLQWSAWDYEEITVSLTTAEVLTVTAAAEPADGSVEIIVDRDPAEDAWDHVELIRQAFENILGDDGKFETVGATPGLGAGWTLLDVLGSPTGTSIALSSTGGIDGQYQVLSATVDDGEGQQIGYAADCVGGDFMILSSWVYPVSLAANAFPILGLIFSANPSHDAQEIIDNRLATYFVVCDTVTGEWRNPFIGVTAPTGARRCLAYLEGWGGVGATAAAGSVRFDTVHFTRNWEGEVAVRGATDITPGADQVTFFDYEMPPELDATYVARAVKADGTVGAWVQSEQDVSWSVVGTSVWVNALDDPSLNRQFALSAAPSATRTQRRTVFPIDGSQYPVVVSDVRSARELTFEFQTETEAEADALLALCEEDIVMIHAPAGFQVASGYWSLGDLQEVHLSDIKAIDHRRWRVDAVEVDAP